jgi:hypothetical protein
MLDMMGHVSAAMLRRYSHIRAKARREAIRAFGKPRFHRGLQEIPKVNDSEYRRQSVTH